MSSFPSEPAPETPVSPSSTKGKFQDMWTSIRTLADEKKETNGTLGRLKKAMEGNPVAESTYSTSIETMLKTMFGSCTTGLDAEESTHADTPQSVHRVSPSDTSETMSPSKEKEAYYYSQFLSADRTRAAQAVHSLREKPTTTEVLPVSPQQQQQRGIQKLESPTRTETKQLPKPFPVSSPTRATQPPQQQMGVPLLVHEVVPPPARETKTQPVLATPSFDDGISAISNHTLDELARQHEQNNKHQKLQTVRSDLTEEEQGFEAIDPNHSGDSSLFPQSDVGNEALDKVGPLGSAGGPFALRRPVRSFGSASKNGSVSMGTKSTESSTTTDFESNWKKDEQQYWQNVVEEEELEDYGPKAGRTFQRVSVFGLQVLAQYQRASF